MQDLFTSSRLDLTFPKADYYAIWKEGHALSKDKKNRFDKVARPEEDCTLLNWDALLKHLQQERESDRAFVFFAIDRELQKWVATISFFDILRSSQSTLWLGYHVLNPYWGKGYGSEAVTASLPFVFESLGIHRIEALAEPENQASLRVLEKADFRFEGLCKRRVKVGDDWNDAKVFALTKEDWEQR